MARKWYGSLNNRLEENRQFCDEITVGTGVTEYDYSDRHPYEVIEVISQKDVIIRGLDHKHIGDGSMDNRWELVSNEDNPTYELVKRGKYWYSKVVVTSDILDEMETTTDNEKHFRIAMFLANNNVVPDTLREKGKVTRYHRWNVSFGKAEYYYDYEF